MTDRHKPTRMWSRAMAGERSKTKQPEFLGWREKHVMTGAGHKVWLTARVTEEDLKMTREFYEPGNGTRYDLIWGYVPPYNTQRIGMPTDPVFMLTWMRSGGSGGVSIVVGPGSFTHETYVSEKMNVGAADAEALAAFINNKLEG